jgi:prefoldin subunit 5
MSAKDNEQIEKLTAVVKKLADELSELNERVEEIENGLSQIAEKAQDAKSSEQWKKLVPLMTRLFP